MITKQKIKEIKEKYKDVFEDLEEYDKTHKLSSDRERVDITLSVKMIRKLKKKKQETGKPISRIIERCLEKELD